jgi:hypothetical protein
MPVPLPVSNLCPIFKKNFPLILNFKIQETSYFMVISHLFIYLHNVCTGTDRLKNLSFHKR